MEEGRFCAPKGTNDAIDARVGCEMSGSFSSVPILVLKRTGEDCAGQEECCDAFLSNSTERTWIDFPSCFFPCNRYQDDIIHHHSGWNKSLAAKKTSLPFSFPFVLLSWACVTERPSGLLLTFDDQKPARKCPMMACTCSDR